MSGGGPAPSPGDNPLPKGAAPPWLLRQRVTVPEPPARYCPRPDLNRRCAPAGRAVTVLTAPGGFGKTTLLAACCRDAAANGVPVAWLTLADDDPATLDTYLAFAFREAGLDLLAPGGAPASAPLPHPRTAAALHVLDALAGPFVLALDELECVTHPDSVALLNDLIRYAPPSLRLALGYRELPRGLDAAVRLLGGGAEIVTANDLRFSTAEIARFFDLALSRRELAAVATESGGWPIAVQVHRNASQDRSADHATAARDAVGNWIAGRFWRGFAPDDRELVLDLALFDWIDADLLDEVLDAPHALHRARRLPALAGLLEPARGAAPGVYRLHPLLREQCLDQRRRDNPGRANALRRRIAAALGRRGATVEAMRHAAAAGDARLAGAILLEAGGLQLWLREGFDRLIAVDRFLSDAAVAANPRLGLARSMALLYQGRLAEANRAYAAACAGPDRRDPGFDLDRVLSLGALAINGCRKLGAAEERALMDDSCRIAALPDTSRVARGALAYGFVAAHHHRAEFDHAVTLAGRARRLVVGRSAHLTMTVDAVLGQSAMARGRVHEALKRYRNARRIGKTHFLQHPRLTAYVDLLTHELALERNRADGNARRTAGAAHAYSVHLPHDLAAAELAAASAHDAAGPDAALAALDDLREHTRSTALPWLDTHLAALRVSLLVDAGRVGEAERAWRGAALPTADAACLDVDTLGWRGAEAIACARVRLLAARGEGAAAEHLEQALAHRAAERGLRRTLMRSLALRVRLAHDARAPDAAQAATAEYLAHFAAADYARPLVRVGAGAGAALERILDADPGAPAATAAARLLAMIRGAKPNLPRLDGRAMAVLRLLPTCPDKVIARTLGLSPDGVRYHLRKIFRALGVTRRQDAVRRARALGILPPVAGDA